MIVLEVHELTTRQNNNSKKPSCRSEKADRTVPLIQTPRLLFKQCLTVLRVINLLMYEKSDTTSSVKVNLGK